mgnify:FL=1
MSGDPSYNKRVIEAHAGNDRSLELALAVGLSPDEFAGASLLMREISNHPAWYAYRSPHGLMVDCIYLMAKNVGIKISAMKMIELTKTIFGVSTQPMPHKWKHQFPSILEEYI